MVLRSLSLIFNPKIHAIEQLKDLDKLKMDELHKIVTTYEMRVEQGKPTKLSIKEATFKASNTTKREEIKMSDNSDNELNEEEANFGRKLKSSKNKGKLSFICEMKIKSKITI
jgi:hypothetical protein